MAAPTAVTTGATTTRGATATRRTITTTPRRSAPSSRARGPARTAGRRSASVRVSEVGRLVSVAVLALALAGAARADTIHLADGREIEGTLVDEGEKVVKIRVTKGNGTAVLEV